MKVEIRPIDVLKWHNKKGKESFTRPKKIQALIDGENMVYATGLNYVDKKYPNPDTGEENVLTEAQYYGKLIGKDLSNVVDVNKPHDFWDSNAAVVKLENNTMILNTTIPIDYIKYKILLGSKYVANSKQEYEEGLYPDATHIIFNEQEEIEVKAKKIDIKNQAIIKASKLIPSRMKQIILLMTNKLIDRNSSEFLQVEMDKLIQSNPEGVLRYIDMDKDVLTSQALVVEALYKNVLKRVGHSITYHDTVLGLEVIDVVEFLNKPQNQELKIAIMGQITKI